MFQGRREGSCGKTHSHLDWKVRFEQTLVGINKRQHLPHFVHVLSSVLPPQTCHSARMSVEKHLPICWSLLPLDTPSPAADDSKGQQQPQLHLFSSQGPAFNGMCKTSPPSPVHLFKKSNHSQDPLLEDVFLDFSSDLKGCSLLHSKDEILIVLQVQTPQSPSALSKKPKFNDPKDSFYTKAVTQKTDAGRILSVCGLPVQDPTLGSALRRSCLFVVGNGKSQNFRTFDSHSIYILLETNKSAVSYLEIY